MSWVKYELGAEPKDEAVDGMQVLEQAEKNNTEIMASASAPASVEVIKHPITKKKKLSSLSSSHDPVNSPDHYTTGGIETIDYIKAKLTHEEFLGYLKGNVIKYTSRAGKKDDVVQDLEKSQWYTARLIKTLKEEV